MASYDATNDIYGPEGPDLATFIRENTGGRDSPIAVGSRVRVAGAGPQPATYGSRTITLDPTQIHEDDPGADDHVGVLELTGEPSAARRVQWDDDVVDNEHMGKKKSKICCIFKKQKAFGESSDESSSDSDSDTSGSESDGGPVSSGSGKGKGRSNDQPCDHSDPSHQRHHNHHRHGAKKAKKRVLNEYERMPKGKDFDARPV
ncbi:Type 1 phosphatases regulator ypi1 [Mortierella sp. GBA30]|nr:Type 1 phosphatases regulator ypi1 [Mortierella sp. GBA30]